MKKWRSKKEDLTGLAIPTGLFIGMGIGFLTDKLVAWMFIGLGIGFALMILLILINQRTSLKNKKN
jgi:cyanate permease